MVTPMKAVQTNRAGDAGVPQYLMPIAQEITP